MSLLKPATNTSAFCKMAIYGEQGTGKTFTSSLMAIGLHKHIKSKKPIAFFDTETGSSFVLELFKNEKIPLVSFKGRAFQDLITVLREAETDTDILIIDSISHVWQEFKTAYMRSKNRSYIKMKEWDKLKESWLVFTDLFVNSKLHIFLCARSANVFEDQEEDEGYNQQKKKTKLVKVGTKMKAEGNLGYESNLLVEMRRVYIGGNKTTHEREAVVIKDRFNVIDSQAFLSPTFKVILPHINKLALGQTHIGVDTMRNSVGMFQDEGESDDNFYKRKEKQLALDEIKATIMHVVGGRTTINQNIRSEVIVQVFDTPSFEKVATLDLVTLKAGLLKIETFKTNFDPQIEPDPKELKSYVAELLKEPENKGLQNLADMDIDKLPTSNGPASE